MINGAKLKNGMQIFTGDVKLIDQAAVLQS